MSDLRELYQQMIIDHGRHPRNFGNLQDADKQKEGFNPLCGDRLTVYLKMHGDVIEAVKFSGEGCAISLASASLMTETLKGKTIADAEAIFKQFHALVTDMEGGQHAIAETKLAVLAGVAEFPARVKCATLCWHTLMAALHGDEQVVSTE